MARASVTQWAQPCNVRLQSHACRVWQRSGSFILTRAEALQTTSAAAKPTTRLRLRIGAKNIPHPEKISYGGEDAYFMSNVGGGALGVADGVGGWQEAGVNPAAYSRTLLDTARRYIEGDLPVAEEVPVPPGWGEQPDEDGLSSFDASATGEWMDALRIGANIRDSADVSCSSMLGSVDDQASSSSAADAAAAAASVEANSNGAGAAAASIAEANSNGSSDDGSSSSSNGSSMPSLLERSLVDALDVAHRATMLPGSTTACLLRLREAEGLLEAANLGDSGFFLIRDGKVVAKSTVLQHYFDCPYQFGMPPHTDYSMDAETLSIPVQPGDAIVAGTDGLLDNLPVEDIVRLAPASPEQVQQAAEAIAAAAAANSADPSYESPYSKEALEEGFDIPIWEKVLKSSFKDGKLQLGKLAGGKSDDITVVTAVVEAEA